MISINNLSFYFGSRPLYQNASLHIKPKNKIGLIGANGTGKSTLLRLITGEYTPDEGEISKAKDTTIGFLNQDLLSYETEDSILLVALQAFERQNDLQHQINQTLTEMEVNYSDKLVDKLTRLQEEFEALDGYSIQSKAEEILEGLGFSTADLNRPLQEFSGGWRMRVMLAKLLLQKPALLMLDEPTNHLDLPSIQWVENYINSYEGAVITVSHDRYFLDRVCNCMVEVSGQKLNLYSGNYSFYLKEKALRTEIQQNAYENQQQHIKQTERFIERFRSKATKARQVQSKIKALERLDLVEEVIDENATVSFKFSFGKPSGKVVSRLEDISKAYGEVKILEDSTAYIERGDKIAFIGANGKGKSTVLRIIDGSEPIQTGKVSEGHNVINSFYAQHQLEALTLNNTILDELKQAGSSKSETELRNILGCFLFTGDDVFKNIKVLSGGEKSRVALAKTLISEANFLLLDEPTNHLDIQSVNILIQALQQYEGTFLTVSHDRHFVSEIANKIWYIEDYELREYPGTYAEFQYAQEQKKTQKNIASNLQKVQKTKSKKSAKSHTKSPAQKKAQREIQRLKKAFAETETQIMDLEEQKQFFETELTKPSIYGNPDSLTEMTEKLQKASSKLNSLNEKWEELALEIEEKTEDF